MTSTPTYASFVKERATRNGPVFDVRFRADGRQVSRSFSLADDAEKFRHLISAVGPIKALQALRIDADETPTVARGALTTFGEWADAMIDDLRQVEGHTLRQYRSHRRNGLARFCDTPIALITKDDVADWVELRQEDGRAAKTIQNEHVTLGKTFKFAVAAGAITDNPAFGAKLPRAIRTRPVFLTTDEFVRLVAVVPAYYQPHVLMLAATGVRFSELTALRRSDFDLSRGMVSITRAWKRRKKDDSWYIGGPKSKAGVRDISIPPSIVEIVERLGRDRLPDELLFTAPEGGRLWQPSFYDSCWAPVRRVVNGQDAYPSKQGMRVKYKRITSLDRTIPFETPMQKWPRVHDLRHSHASWLIEQGVPLPVIQNRLGHDSILTTVSIYGHLSPTSREQASVATDAALAGAISMVRVGAEIDEPEPRQLALVATPA